MLPLLPKIAHSKSMDPSGRKRNDQQTQRSTRPSNLTQAVHAPNIREIWFQRPFQVWLLEPEISKIEVHDPPVHFQPATTWTLKVCQKKCLLGSLCKFWPSFYACLSSGTWEPCKVCPHHPSFGLETSRHDLLLNVVRLALQVLQDVSECPPVLI